MKDTNKELETILEEFDEKHSVALYSYNGTTPLGILKADIHLKQIKELIKKTFSLGEQSMREKIYQELDQLWVDNHGREFSFELAFEKWNREFFKEE